MPAKPKPGCVDQAVKIGCLSMVAIAFAAYFISGRGERNQRAPAPPNVTAALGYLSSVPEVSWWAVSGRDVFIGFPKPLPEDWNLILRGAALHAHKAAGHTVHAWAVPESNRAFRPGLDPDYGNVTARDGRVER